MALPTSMGQNRDPLTRTGIVLGVFGSTQANAELEVWRSTQSASTASTLWSITRYPPTTLAAYTIPYDLPLSTRYHNFKARSLAIGYRASTFTPLVRAKPVKFSKYPASPTVPTNAGYTELPNPIFMNASQTMIVGAPSQVTPTTYREKEQTIHPTEFVPFDETRSFTYTNTDFRISATTSLTMFAPILLAPGVVATSASVRVYRETTANSFTITFVRRSSDNTATVLLTLSSTVNTSTGWYTIGNALGPHTWTTQGYTIQASLRGANPSDTRLGWASIKYRMPDYAKAI